MSALLRTIAGRPAENKKCREQEVPTCLAAAGRLRACGHGAILRPPRKLTIPASPTYERMKAVKGN